MEARDFSHVRLHCITIDFGNEDEWAYNSNELSLASDVKDMTLEEFSNKYLVCVNATYLN